MSIDELINGVKSGDHTVVELKRLEFWINAQKKALAPPMPDFIIGSKVRLNNKCRPRYMVGATGVVIKVNEKSVGIKLDDGCDPRAKRFEGGRCPKSLVELIER